MKTLSVIIITKNAEASIERCLKSISWADEIIILDSGSTDRTVSICQQYTSQVQQTDWPGFGPQKNRALSKSTKDFVLSIDSDEWLTDELKTEIQRVLKDPQHAGYQLKRHNIYWGRVLKHGNDGPELILRLFERTKGAFTNTCVHERVDVDGSTGTLKSPLLHEPYTSIKVWLNKMNRYSTLSAKQKIASGKKTKLFSPFYKSSWFFIRGYFLKLGLLDGRSGLICATLNGISTFFRYLKMYLIQRNFNLK